MLHKESQGLCINLFNPQYPERRTQNDTNFAAFFLLCLTDSLKININVCLRKKFDVAKMFANFIVTINKNESENH